MTFKGRINLDSLISKINAEIITLHCFKTIQLHLLFNIYLWNNYMMGQTVRNIAPIYIYKNIRLLNEFFMDDLSFIIFDSKTPCVQWASHTSLSRQRPYRGWRGKAGVIAACAGGDRRKLEMTVGAQVMTDEGKGGQEIRTGDNRGWEGYGGYVQEMRGDDTGSTGSDRDDEDSLKNRGS